MFGVSYTEAYRSAKHFLHSILKCKELAIGFPKNSEEWESVRKGVSERSHMGMESMCVGAVDGFFQYCMRPNIKKLEMSVPIIQDIMNITA